MEQHNVYHYHHHHYHYHYTYPFPPGLPPNIPQNNEPLNQEVADRDNDESSAEEEEEEEYSERRDTEDQHNPEDRSPTPVQWDTELNDFERSGFVVFDDSLACLDLDGLSLEAQARFTNTQPNGDDHPEGPPRKKARTSSHTEHPMPQRTSINSPSQPRKSNHITVIDKARIVATNSDFRVVNCDPSGPQIDICWRVPGHRNIWLARVGYAGGSRKKLRTLMKAQAPPNLPFLSCLEAPLDEENAVSLIECSSSDHKYDDFEQGIGQVVPGDITSSEFVSALGRMVGFEVLRG
ncbi:hypothetical protein FACUT_10174 [Fusarium acutatum]|uniref:Uncharacterized protein n=1 Tax=Fusarium acutatum TaxID=78861 RepID=A0A8H4JGZ5_9HYPO|nr:hypothetical protein FACUT_10174 [Fusarium acutatum]